MSMRALVSPADDLEEGIYDDYDFVSESEIEKENPNEVAEDENHPDGIPADSCNKFAIAII